MQSPTVRSQIARSGFGRLLHGDHAMPQAESLGQSFRDIDVDLAARRSEGEERARRQHVSGAREHEARVEPGRQGDGDTEFLADRAREVAK